MHFKLRDKIKELYVNGNEEKAASFEEKLQILGGLLEEAIYS